MKSLMLLWRKVAEELATSCCTSATRDIETVACRVEHEGMSFLTITLPEFGKDFERSLDQGQVLRSTFRRTAYRRGLPVFLGGFLNRVFDAASGELVDEPCIDSIQAVRQLTLMFSKIELPCSPKRVDKAFDGYIDCEKDVAKTKSEIPEQSVQEFRTMASMLYGQAFEWMNSNVHHSQLVPKHGPGSTADRLLGNKKFVQKTWPRRLERLLPLDGFLVPNPSFERDQQAVRILEPREETPVRVITVPKTLKAPRIIGIEPTAMQYAQQSVLPVLLRGLAQDNFLSKVIGFDDQTPNQEFARLGSLSGDLATLDLSEASDRVPNWLVQELFANHSQLNAVVQATRSRTANVHGHGCQTLAKFASMGSALCFPVEAMVFMTVIFIGISRSLNSPMRWNHAKSMYSSKVRVFGDDIIVPTHHVQSVVDALHEFGFVVNVSKSFWNGKFRESCGKEFYDGHDVSVVKVRKEFPKQRGDAREVIAIVELRNQMYYSGLWQTVRWLDELIKKCITHFPTVLPTSPLLGRHSFLGYDPDTWGDDLHDPRCYGYVEHSVPPSDPLDGSGALLKCLLMLHQRDASPQELPTLVQRHLERAGRPKSVRLRFGCVSAV